MLAKSEGCGMWMEPVLRKLLAIAFPDSDFGWGTDHASFAVVSHFIKQERPDYDSKLPYIIWSGENSSSYPTANMIKKHPPLAVFHTSMAAKKDFPDIPFFHLPFAMFRYSNSKVREFTDTNRQKFMAYVASNPVPMRDSTFRLFQSSGVKPLSYGRCCKNVPGYFGGGFANLSHIYRQHRFALTFENCDEMGYVTEKIMNAYIAGCIPVYWGSQGFVKKMFNPASFIYLSDFESPEEMVKYVIMVDNDTDMYNSFLSEPVFIGNKPTEYFDFDTPSTKIQEMADFLRNNLPL